VGPPEKKPAEITSGWWTRDRLGWGSIPHKVCRSDYGGECFSGVVGQRSGAKSPSIKNPNKFPRPGQSVNRSLTMPQANHFFGCLAYHAGHGLKSVQTALGPMLPRKGRPSWTVLHAKNGQTTEMNVRRPRHDSGRGGPQNNTLGFSRPPTLVTHGFRHGPRENLALTLNRRC